ncbi:hypothetical protein [Candidatus Solirubrobacter pratensis]|uniref:hypothetical protein n=1 Tax=Candidatus Solirubrobacter pratensis TaxID=1298857 RepID=UPI00047FE908|nr:hypothetical protein [Candidatus Solirubrobacter pratensis]
MRDIIAAMPAAPIGRHSTIADHREHPPAPGRPYAPLADWTLHVRDALVASGIATEAQGEEFIECLSEIVAEAQVKAALLRKEDPRAAGTRSWRDFLALRA